MVGGPFMNFVQAFVLFAIVLMGFGVATLNTTVLERSRVRTQCSRASSRGPTR